MSFLNTVTCLPLLLSSFYIVPVFSSPQLYEVQAQAGAVASESSVCSNVGISLLSQGGNAADAMVGTTLCVGVIALQHSGIAGGGFMTVRAPSGAFEVIDFRETAPAAAYETMYSNNSLLSLLGGLASGVPGELRGLEYLHQNYGQLDWETVVQPAVGIARDGFVITEDLAPSLKGPFAYVNDEATWAIDFAPNGTQLGLGDTMTRKRYAATLEEIGKSGAAAFYTGTIANATIQAVTKAGGIMTLDDLQNYTVISRKPSMIDYRGYKIWSASAPSSGTVALATLKILEGYDAGDPAQINSTTHYLDQSLRFAYGQRTQLGDPSFVANVSTFEENMLSADTINEIRSKISPNMTFDVSYYDPLGIESLETPGTSHIVSADASGMAISLTTTINTDFGSGVMVPETGVIMNNEMNDFSTPNITNFFGYLPSPANFIEPGKRPLSSMSPSIVETSDGNLYYCIGAAGGSRIITATVQNLWHVLDQGMTVSEALAQPRLHDQLVPETTTFEWSDSTIMGYDNSTVAYLQQLGYNVSFIAPGQSQAQGLRVLPNGTFEAAGEPRQVASGGATR